MPDGMLPARIERFLLEHAGMRVGWAGVPQGHCNLRAFDAHGLPRYFGFTWDREELPSLQEAIEAVLDREGGCA